MNVMKGKLVLLIFLALSSLPAVAAAGSPLSIKAIKNQPAMSFANNIILSSINLFPIFTHNVPDFLNTRKHSFHTIPSLSRYFLSSGC